MANFDSALRESCTVRESRTNTPLQALNLMNDVQFVEAARALAQRVMRGAGSSADRLTLAYQLVLGRAPADYERKELTASRDYYLRYFDSQPKAAADLLKQGASVADASLPQPELASWTVVCNLILNLDEALTKE
jgi:hypothetical protein